MAFGKYNLDLSVVHEDNEDLFDFNSGAVSHEPSPTEDDEIAKMMAQLQNLIQSKSSKTHNDENEIARLREMNAKLKMVKSEMDDKENREAEIKILRAKTKQRALEVKLAKKLKDIRGVARLVCDVESVDLAFVIDCTSSMQAVIDAVRSQIREV